MTRTWESVRSDFYAAQDGHCAICRTDLTPREAQLDHCHTTGQIRGVLCTSCNTKLGARTAKATRRSRVVTFDGVPHTVDLSLGKINA